MDGADKPLSERFGVTVRMIIACGPVAALVAVGIILMWLGGAQDVAFVYKGF